MSYEAYKIIKEERVKKWRESLQDLYDIRKAKVDLVGVTIKIPQEVLFLTEVFVQKGYFTSRSEFFRKAIMDALLDMILFHEIRDKMLKQYIPPKGEVKEDKERKPDHFSPGGH